MKKLEDMIEPELKDLLEILAERIQFTCTNLDVEPLMFVLLLFNDPEVAQYISNCQREDVIKALRESADRLEKGEDIPR